MKINLKYFASVREALGKDGETVTTLSNSVAALRAELIAKGEPYTTSLANPRVRAAVNHAMVTYEAAIGEGDEVAFFPPVTGG
jgi:molybdopterin synthase sulfur carrier subunit